MISSLGILLILSLFSLDIGLELIPPIPKIPDRIHIKTILPHTHSIPPDLRPTNMRLLIRLLTIHLNPLLEFLLILRLIRTELRILLRPYLNIQYILHLHKLALVQGEHLALPLPFEIALAVGALLTDVDAVPTDLLVYDRDGL